MQYRGGEDGSRDRSLALWVSLLAAFLAFLDVTIVNVAFPSIRQSFSGATLPELSWVLNAYNVVFAALLLPAGRVADVIGRGRVFVAGIIVFTLASLLCAAAPSLVTLIAARVVQAAGAAVLVATSLALVLELFPPERRATGVGIFGAVAAVSAATGPSLGGALVEVSDWRAVFVVNLPLGAAALVMARAAAVRSRGAGGGALPDPVGVATVTLGLGLLALGIVQGNDWGWSGARVLLALGAGATLILVFLLRSRGDPAAVVESSLFRLPSLAAANLGTMVFAAGFYAMLLCNVLYLTQVWGYSTLTAGLALSPGPLTSAIAAGPAGRVADRFGQRVVVVPGTLIFAVGIASFIFRVGTDPAFVAEWLPSTICTGLGIGLTFPALASAAVGAVPGARFGIGSALNATSRQIGAVLGIAILVAVLGRPLPSEAPQAFDEGWTFIALAGLASLPAALHLRRS
jgi:NTE family protein